MTSNTSNKMARHNLDDERLGQYLKQEIAGLQLPLVSTKIGYGQSNPTYFLDDATGTRYILRKRPSGAIISPVAHRIDREYRVLKALGTVDGFPVPKVFCLCMDDKIIGTAFYVRFFLGLLWILRKSFPGLWCIRLWNLSKGG